MMQDAAILSSAATDLGTDAEFKLWLFDRNVCYRGGHPDHFSCPLQILSRKNCKYLILLCCYEPIILLRLFKC